MRTTVLEHGAIPRVGVTLRAVDLPVQRLEILPRIRPTLRGRHDVVNLPSILRIGVPVFRILHNLAASVVPPNLLVEVFDRFALRPNLQLGRFISAFERVCVCHGVCGGEFILENVKEHAPLSAGARVERGLEVDTTEDHVNRAADRGCVSRLVRLWVIGIQHNIQ